MVDGGRVNTREAVDHSKMFNAQRTRTYIQGLRANQEIDHKTQVYRKEFVAISYRGMEITIEFSRRPQ